MTWLLCALSAFAAEPAPAAAPVVEVSPAAAFVPLPGFPSLLARDLRGLGLSWAVAVPSTAAFVLVARPVASNTRQLVTLSFIGYAVSTLAANQLFAPSAPVLSIVPNEGGVTAVATIPLR